MKFQNRQMLLFKCADSMCDDGCPYYEAPPLDFPKNQQYHICSLSYKSSLNLFKLMEICPLTTLETVLEDYAKSDNGDVDVFVKEEIL